MERKGEFASEREREEIIFREREIVRESERGTLDLKRPLNAKRKTPTC